MKKLIKSSLSVALAALLSVSMMAHSGDGVAEEGSSSGISYNIGYMSEYWYRGVYQAESSVSFGADMEMGNIYIGTWWADVDQGVEYDIYAGYNFELMGIPMYAGYTGYFYSDNFDGDYQELNIGGDFGFMSVDAAVNGVYDSVSNGSITTQGYQHYTITVPGMMMGLPLDYSYQTFAGELTGFTHEISYGTTVSGVDVGLTLGKNSDDSTGSAANKDTTYANFTLGYSF
tara:strand:- start:167 stop:856 length:690 start_codon:yes stop_codon:yes gene_type:complete